MVLKDVQFGLGDVTTILMQGNISLCKVETSLVTMYVLLEQTIMMPQVNFAL
jgi:hypothetical protein